MAHLISFYLCRLYITAAQMCYSSTVSFEQLKKPVIKISLSSNIWFLENKLVINCVICQVWNSQKSPHPKSPWAECTQLILGKLASNLLRTIYAHSYRTLFNLRSFWWNKTFSKVHTKACVICQVGKIQNILLVKLQGQGLQNQILRNFFRPFYAHSLSDVFNLHSLLRVTQHECLWR